MIIQIGEHYRHMQDHVDTRDTVEIVYIEPDAEGRLMQIVTKDSAGTLKVWIRGEFERNMRHTGRLPFFTGVSTAGRGELVRSFHREQAGRHYIIDLYANWSQLEARLGRAAIDNTKGRAVHFQGAMTAVRREVL